MKKHLHLTVSYNGDLGCPVILRRDKQFVLIDNFVTYREALEFADILAKTLECPIETV